MLKYTVTVCGGRGPDTWYTEFTIEAENFGDAYTRAQAVMGPRGEWDFVSIQEED